MTSDTMSLSASGVTVKFGGHTAVNGVDLTITSGRVTGLIGPNGAGKSTFINAITGFIRLDDGEVILHHGTDINLTTKAPEQRARLGVGRTFQTPRLIPALSVLENVTLGHSWKVLRTRWFEALGGQWLAQGRQERLALAHDMLKDVGLDIPPETPVSSLSLGQQRLVEIARAAYSGSGVLLLDEPFAGLSIAEHEVLSNEVRRLRQNGTAVLLVEHQLDRVRELCDFVLAMDMGAPLIQGSPDEVLDSALVRDRYLGEVTS